MNNLFSAIEMGKNSIMAQQSVFSIIGHNIANVNTPGYSRQVVDLENVRPSVIGLKDGGRGVDIYGIRSVRDQFIDNQITDRKQYAGLYDSLGTIMASVEALFNESQGLGISDGMSNFFNAWNDVANQPTDIPTRNALVSKANSFALNMSNTSQRLTDQQEVYDGNVGVLVDEINAIATEIAELNEEIAYAEGSGNPANDLLDTRERRIRELSEKVGINHYYDTSNHSVTIEVAGRPLVSFTTVNELTAQRNQYNSNYYDVYMTQGGTATFNLTNDITTGDLGANLLGRDGNTVQGAGQVNGITVGVPAAGQSTVDFTQDHLLSTGDLITIDGQTRSVISVLSTTSVVVADFNPAIAAGDLPANWQEKDGYIPEYKKYLNNLSTGLVRNVNDAHRSGYGLGDDVLANRDFFQMSTGNGTAASTIGTNQITFSASIYGTLSVGDVITIGEDARTITEIINANTVSVDANSSATLTTAAGGWGYNNRQGSAASMAVDSTIYADSSLIAASSLPTDDGTGVPLAVGNNDVALAMAQLMDTNDMVDTNMDGQGNYGTFHEYLHTLYSEVGNAGSTANYEYEANSSMLNYLENKRDSISAVSLDEEAANLMQFEKSYQALAQFMGTISQLTDVLINIV